jgi:hypothetical protein
MSKTIFPEPTSCETCYFITNFDEDKDTYVWTQSVAIGVMDNKFTSILANYMTKETEKDKVAHGFVHLLLNRKEVEEMIKGLQEARIKMDTLTEEEIKKLKN